MFADAQIFTSLAILIGAYASLSCDIVAYHWQYMIYLAWLASITHLASLSFLRNHLANNPVKRAWRLVAMCIIQVMLSVAVGLSMTFAEDPWVNGRGGRPAHCYFQEQVKTSSVTCPRCWIDYEVGGLFLYQLKEEGPNSDHFLSLNELCGNRISTRKF